MDIDVFMIVERKVLKDLLNSFVGFGLIIEILVFIVMFDYVRVVGLWLCWSF